jgi:RNA polymerase sigma-70 factor (ECF subfamily)
MPEEETTAALERNPGAAMALGTQPTASVEQEALQRQLHRRLAAVCQRLKPKQRLAVVLRWMQGYSVQEISEITGARVNTVRGRLRNGKKELRRLILQDPVLKELSSVVLS